MALVIEHMFGYNNRMEADTDTAVVEDEIAEQCGILNVATGRLVSLIGRVLAAEAYAGAGIRSPEQWVAWKCGVSLGRARALVNIARRRPELSVTRSALEAGELVEDQVAVICRPTPAHNDAEAAELGRSATVPQLRRALGRHSFAKPAADPVEPEPEERRRVGFGFGDDGMWRLSAVQPPDEGAQVERALGVLRQKLLGEGDFSKDVTWADDGRDRGIPGRRGHRPAPLRPPPGGDPHGHQRRGRGQRTRAPGSGPARLPAPVHDL